MNETAEEYTIVGPVEWEDPVMVCVCTDFYCYMSMMTPKQAVTRMGPKYGVMRGNVFFRTSWNWHRSRIGTVFRKTKN